MPHSHAHDHHAHHSSSCVSGDVLDLIRPIRNIITAPGVDMKKISAKQVRRKLVADGHTSEAFVQERKPAIDALIGAIYAQATGKEGAEKVYASDEDE